MDTLLSTRSGRFQDHLPIGASQCLKRAAVEQDNLGRISVFQGYISKQWAEAQLEYWSSLPPRRRKSIKQWKCSFLRGWYSFMRTQWDHRNDWVQKQNKEAKKKTNEEDVNRKVLEQINKGVNGLRQNDLHLMENVVEAEMLKLDVKKKAQWVESVEIARKRIRRQETTEMSRMRQFLRHWILQSR